MEILEILIENKEWLDSYYEELKTKKANIQSKLDVVAEEWQKMVSICNLLTTISLDLPEEIKEKHLEAVSRVEVLDIERQKLANYIHDLGYKIQKVDSLRGYVKSHEQDYKDRKGLFS